MDEIEDGIVTNVGGDLMDTLVRQLRGQDRPFSLMTHDQQAEVLDRIRRHVANGVREAVHAIAAAGRVTVAADLEKVVFGDKGVQATLTIASHDPSRLALADSRGKACLIVVADAAAHMGGIDDQQPEPDQGRIAA